MELSDDKNYTARFERIESVLETIAHSQKQLLTAQVVMTDQISQLAGTEVRLAEAQMHLTEAQARLAEAQAKSEVSSQETQDKLSALIHMWDDWIRERRAKEGGGPTVQ